MNRNLWLALGGIFCLWATRTIAFVLIPLVAVGIGLPGVTIGVLVGVLAGLGLITDIPVAGVSDRIGRKTLMVIGAVLTAVAGLTLSITADFARLLAAAAAFGVSLSLFGGPVLAYVTEHCRLRDTARIQGYNGAIQSLAALAGAIAIGLAVDRVGPQPGAWLIVGLAFAAVLAFVCVDEVSRRADLPSKKEIINSYAEAVGLLVARPQLQLAALVSLLWDSVVFVVGNSFLPLYVIHDLGDSAVLAGSLLAVRNVAMIASSPVFGLVVRRFGVIPTTLGANSLAVLGTISIAFVTDSRLLAVPLVLQGIGVGLTPAISSVLVISDTTPHERALGFAASSFVSRTGSLLTPVLFGAILGASSGARGVFVAGGVIGIGYLALMFWRVRFGTPAQAGHGL